MKKIITFATLFLPSVILISCKKEGMQADKKIEKEVSQADLSKISAMGFSTKNIIEQENSFLVEGDIVIPKDGLSAVPETQFLRVGEEEQYRTTNLVCNLPKTITIRFTGVWPSQAALNAYTGALDVAIARYNALNLRLTFRRIANTATPNIYITTGNGPFLASAGFPRSCKPYNYITVNPYAIGNQPVNTVATILAHEIGHCIGFRHTDYFNRAYSCGGQPVNEGPDAVGAVRIPGTPSGGDPTSWMLACIGSGVNRPFNSNDVTALRYLYR